MELECGIEEATLKSFEGPYFGGQGKKTNVWPCVQTDNIAIQELQSHS